MINIIPASKRYSVDFEGIKGYWLFSYSDYFDHDNLQFGPLKVFNDITLAPGSSFRSASFHGVDVFNFVISGSLLFNNSVKKKAVLASRNVAGIFSNKRYRFALKNDGKIPARILNIAIESTNGKKNHLFKKVAFKETECLNKLCSAVSDSSKNSSLLKFGSDANIHWSLLTSSKRIFYNVKPSRWVYLYMIRGVVKLNGKTLNFGFQARMDNVRKLTINAIEDSDFILIGLPSCTGLCYENSIMKKNTRK